MPAYDVCRLVIQSEIPLPELTNSTEAAATADVVIRRGKLDRPQPSLMENGLYVQANDREIFLCWEMVGAFELRGNSEVVVDANPDVEESLVRLLLLGVVLATLLHRRGFLVLHGSAVAIGGSAVAFIGEKGMGKSTTATAFYKRGHSLVTDDIVAIDFADLAQPMIYPSFPQVKLWPDAAESLGDNPEELPLIISGMVKRARRAAESFSLEPVPLKKIYVLSSGPSLSIERLKSQEALAQLLTHSYSARVGSQLLRGQTGGQHLLQCAKIVNSIPVCWLHRQRSLEALSDIVDLVEADVEALSHPPARALLDVLPEK